MRCEIQQKMKQAKAIKHPILFVILLFNLSSSLAQSFQARLSDKVYIGGGAGLNVGNNDFLNVNVSPMIGYKITDEFSTGLRLTYQYARLRDNAFNNYGGGPFAAYRITDQFFAYTEYEYLNFGFNTSGQNLRDSYSAWFVGGGYSDSVGGRITLGFMVLYNLLYYSDDISPYDSPLVYRGGVFYGF